MIVKEKARFTEVVLGDINGGNKMEKIKLEAFLFEMKGYEVIAIEHDGYIFHRERPAKVTEKKIKTTFEEMVVPKKSKSPILSGEKILIMTRGERRFLPKELCDEFTDLISDGKKHKSNVVHRIVEKYYPTLGHASIQLYTGMLRQYAINMHFKQLHAGKSSIMQYKHNVVKVGKGKSDPNPFKMQRKSF